MRDGRGGESVHVRTTGGDIGGLKSGVLVRMCTLWMLLPYEGNLITKN